MAESKINLVPLNGSNYATWKLQCQMALMKEGLWNIVSKTENPPGSGASEEVVAKYKARMDRALATIVLSIEPSLLYLLGSGEPKDPVEVWTKLQSQFQKKSWANKLVLRRKLYSLKLKKGASVQDHIKEMTELFNDLAVVGDNLGDEDRVVHLLASLPESYDTLVTALEASESVPSMEVVIDRLLYEEKKTKDRAEGTDEALIARGRKKMRCHYCKKIGHMQKDCYERARNEKSRHPQKKGKKSGSEGDNSIGLLATHTLAAAASDNKTNNRNCWIIDSGATCHISCNKTMFDKIESMSEPQIVTLGDGSSIETSERGTVKLKLKQVDGTYKDCTLYDVLYVPELSYNLLSITKATELGKTVKFDKSTCVIISNGDIVGSATKTGSLYYLNCQMISSHQRVNTVKEGESAKVWHQRFGHLNVSSLKQLASKQMVTGLSYADVANDMEMCEPCIQGKHHRSPFPATGGKRAQELLGLVHSDVCGKINSKSLGGAEYFLTFKDDKTRYTWVYFLKHKNEVFNCFKEWKAMVERESGHKVKILRSDNGGEYTSGEFESYLKDNGIKHELTVPRSPEQNGVAERLNRTLIESVRSMLFGAHLPQRFWAEALATAVYLRNRSPTKSVTGLTPYEAWSGDKPSVNHLKVFGCAAYAHISKEERRKLDPKGKKCILLGYGTTVKGYRLYSLGDNRVIYSRDVVFDENSYGFEKEEIETTDEAVKTIEIELSNGETDKTAENSATPEAEEQDEDEPPLRRSTREKRPTERYGVWINATQTMDCPEPSTAEEAFVSPEKKMWIEAMNKEMKSLEANNVYDLVELPRDRKMVGSKWVFKRKLKEDGSVERYKARLVAQGFLQRAGQDYDETFCPVVRFESIRSILAMAAQKGLIVHQMDVTSAFLNGNLDEEVYMAQPEGFEVKGKEHLVCRLKRSLYGLKQAPRCWNATLNNQLIKMGFVQTDSDPCVYVSSEGEFFIIAVYVDDILLAGKSNKRMTEVKQALSSQFEVKDLGELHYLLGITVKQDHVNQSIWIGQPAYTTSILEKFGMKDAKSIATPVNTGLKLTRATEEDDLADERLYQQIVGSLQYLSTMTRPDITYAVSTVAKFCSKPTKVHFTAVKRILRYLKGTSNHGLLYKKASSSNCVGYSDSDWAGDTDDRKSTSGYVFLVGDTAITWKSKKQSCVALSTAEAEYIALSQAAQEALWLRQLATDLQDEQQQPTVIYEDNQATICMSKNPQSHGKSKHIEIKYHFVREHVNGGAIELKYCQTENMIADMLTKGLGKQRFEKLRSMAGVSEQSSIK